MYGAPTGKILPIYVSDIKFLLICSTNNKKTEKSS